jgi:hypothetical protein
MGIACEAIGPVVFYKGFTRAFLGGETESSKELLDKSAGAVNAIGAGKKFVLIDGVGYPSVGSICGLSNAHVAAASKAPVLLVGKSGVGDAVDSYNLNATYFEHRGLTVMGGIFNKFSLDGYYGLEACKTSIVAYFENFKQSHFPYGFMPTLSFESENEMGGTKILINFIRCFYLN